jgi:hypothetical protein
MSITYAMDNDTPRAKFVVTVKVPHSIWTRTVVVTTLDCAIAACNLGNRINASQGRNDPMALNPEIIGEQGPTNIPDPCIGMFYFVVLHQQVKICIGDG